MSQESSTSGDYVLLEDFLKELNKRQFEAVTSSPNGRLQIIAGPGTGKTKVLISRVAYLLLAKGIRPERLIVTTFTKRAANEMIERLRPALQGSGVDLNKLLIGTFHSICFRVLRIYGYKIGIDGYKIADERDSNQILQNVLHDLTPEELDLIESLPQEENSKLMLNSLEAGKNNGFDYKKVKRSISKLKSSGLHVDDYQRAASQNKVLLLIYEKYQEQLRKESLLDFDDCLLMCHKLIRTHPVLNLVEHVLVDEFQDTNEIQLRLMYEFARGSCKKPDSQHNVTIVGDPDQSIYAFRDAQCINFEKMKSHYQKLQLPCKIVMLNENYRSTNHILELSEKIMSQQGNRMAKDLKSQMPNSILPVYHSLDSAEKEARWIAYQIEHILALPGTPLEYSDIAILLRTSSQTRLIENTFMKRRVPHFMVRGKAFWERKEVVSIVDYLRIIIDVNDRLAYLRTLNFPKRGMGDRTIAQIDEAFRDNRNEKSIYDRLALMAKSDAYGIKLSTKAKENLQAYISFVDGARAILADVEQSVEYNGSKNDILAGFLEHVYVNSGLQKEFQSDPNCELNIKEVEKQLCEFEPVDESIPAYDGGSEEDKSVDNRGFVEKFIHSIGLYETTSANDSDITSDAESRNDKGKVALSTIHGSKGLEWPVVFVPGLSEGLLPAKFAIDKGGEEAVDEERRCFYVATTRAKTLLYISSYVESENRASWVQRPIENISRYVSHFIRSPMVKLEGMAFNDQRSLTFLYQQNGKEYPQSTKFNFSTFQTLYVGRLEAFLRGEEFSIVSHDFEKTIEDFKLVAPNPFKCAKLISNQSASSHLNGFDSAARLQKSKEQKQRKQKKSLQAMDITKLLNSDRSSTMVKSHCMDSAVVNNVVSKAPHYARDSQSYTTPSTKNTGNKAPPYIPVRKVPKSILERRKKLGQQQ